MGALPSLLGQVRADPAGGSLFWRHMSIVGAVAGLGAMVGILVVTNNDPLYTINSGVAGLVLNVAVNVLVSKAWPGSEPTSRWLRARSSKRRESESRRVLRWCSSNCQVSPAKPIDFPTRQGRARFHRQFLP